MENHNNNYVHEEMHNMHNLEEMSKYLKLNIEQKKLLKKHIEEMNQHHLCHDHYENHYMDEHQHKVHQDFKEQLNRIETKIDKISK